MNSKWVNESRENDSTDHSCYSLENIFACAVVRKAYEEMEPEHANQWIVIFNTKWERPMPMFVIAPKEQSSAWHTDFESAVDSAEKWFTGITEDLSSVVSEKINKLKGIAQQKGYKSGWVWHQIKNEYNTDIANEFLPK